MVLQIHDQYTELIFTRNQERGQIGTFLCARAAWGKLPTMTSEAVVRPGIPNTWSTARDWLSAKWERFYSANQSTFSLLSRGPVFQLLIAVTGFVIIFSRRPDAILNAQFWAEDGQRWYADAYQFGLRCLLIPDELGGYFHSVSRLSALTALVFPFYMAPLVMNLFAIALQR